MSVKVFANQEVQDLLTAAANLDSDDGNARAKQITHRMLSDLFKAIDDLDMTPDEIWAGVNYFNKPGRTARRRCLLRGSDWRSTSTCGWMPPTSKPKWMAARRARSKVRCMSKARRCAMAYRGSISTKTRTLAR